MIKYDKLFILMKTKSISQYDLIHKYGISRGQLDRLKQNHNVTIKTLDTLCNILNCQLGDITEHYPDSNTSFKPFNP